MDRGTFLFAAAGIAGLRADAEATPIIDTHIHLFDPTRPQGVPWPDEGRRDPVQARFARALSAAHKGLGIVGAIEVECSPWLEDNQWVLDIAAKDPIIVGTVGDLEPGKPDFRKHLERFHRNPLFRGIRYGNLWKGISGNSCRSRISSPTSRHWRMPVWRWTPQTLTRR